MPDLFISGGQGGGGTIDLTADVTGVLPVANGGSGTSTEFTPGSIVFAGASGVYTQDNAGLFWDDTNNRLGINDNTPGFPLEVVGNSMFQGNIFVLNATTLNDRELTFIFDGTVKLQNNSTNGAAGMVFNGAASGSGFVTFLSTSGSGTTDFINFRTGNNGAVEAMHINTAGLVGIGTSTFPSAGSKAIIFGDGTVPSSMGSDTAGLYANDVSGTVNLFAINEAGESTRLTYPAPETYSVSNVTTDRTYDANSTSIDELADVLGSLIADLRARGIVA